MITTLITKENNPKLNPKISPSILNSAVTMFKYPKMQKSINHSIDIYKIVLKNYSFDNFS